ncbi:MAG: hypothetical protein OEZ39_20290 [Gammaproteobacteria bacterium]|nr:hypothetical protein [Gammaproteobacteria bacterium]
MRDRDGNIFLGTGKGKDFYTYRSTALALAFGGNATDNINIEASSDFLVQKLTYQVDIAAAAFTDSTRPIPNVTLQITDTGSGQQFFSDALPIPMIFGTGQVPFILPIPRLVMANSALQLAYTNYDAAVTYNIYLGFIGMKIYR